MMEIYIDRGGTFTDCIAWDTNTNKSFIVKLLSVDSSYPDAPREGIRRILEQAKGISIPRTDAIPSKDIKLIRMATTVATNSLLERNGEPSVLIVTKGFKDALMIGNQARPNIFDLSIASQDVLYQHVIEVDERVTLVGYTSSSTGLSVSVPSNDPTYVKGTTGEWIHIQKTPNLNDLRIQLQSVYNQGIKSVSICFIHSFTFPLHEKQVKELCKEIGFDYITLSSEIMPMIKFIPRANSAVADAYLTPCIQRYLKGFFSGFDDGIKNVCVEFMQSDGGLSPVDQFTGFRAILSGPAGGVVGYAMTSWENGKNAVIGFDMGGTSTDVSRFDGKYEHVYETTTAGITIQAPQLDINTVAAGGGSRLFFQNGMFVVGPESVGATPGPACYRKGGPLAITDANLLLGRLIADYFPKIFGPKENESLDWTATRKKFEILTSEINAFLKESGQERTMSVDEVAYGFIRVANESMCRPIRSLTQSKGFDTRNHILSCFGGAGAQHACAIAKGLGIKLILIHKYCSILSAYGLSLADVVCELQEPSALILSDQSMTSINNKIESLSESCKTNLTRQGFPFTRIQIQVYLNLRYQGTDTSIMILKNGDFKTNFVQNYQAQFGFTLADRDIVVDDIRVRGIGKSTNSISQISVYREIDTLHRMQVTLSTAERVESVFWDGKRVDTPVYLLDKLSVSSHLEGPALIINKNSTIAVEPDCSALVTSEHVVLFVGSNQSTTPKQVSCDQVDPILLGIFGHRFMSIAEQMGYTLQKTSISTNIKERLDFSCAVFSHDGGLVANAPHIPVHLGSMQEAVRWQMKHLGSNIKEGDVLMTNHPAAGGSHLPDITIITPVFDNQKIVFFVASRGHHADIGGIAPGSMPPNSRELYQEGASIKSFKLVTNNTFDESGVTRILLHIPAQYEGCSGTRCLQDNISDLKAQVAANHRGSVLVKNLIKEYGLDMVLAYMSFIQQNAEIAVRNLLKDVSKRLGSNLQAHDYMDDGTRIQLSISIDQENGTAVFDFEGTGYEVYANWNAPRSVTCSAIIYCLRCLINLDIPLNQGALAPITIKIPDQSILNPSEEAAVVGGNVMTSQRLCDVILKAFDACSGSQGCCNNFTFGKGGKNEHGEVEEGFGYYETIGGGAGAGSSWDGKSGVHTHMTNTRLTDVEILERRYPVILHEFGLRKGSGGQGKYKGGDGIVREIEFLETLHVSMLSERRVYRPYGLHGGEDGQPGLNVIKRKGASKGTFRLVNFGGKNSTICHPGDRIRIETPGGGGWGSESSSSPRKRKAPIINQRVAGGSLQNYKDTQMSF